VVRCERVPQDGPRVRLRFAVTDTGIGIAPDKLRTVFEPFTQADGSTTRKYGGTGLGLTICTRLVALMDGRVWAESEPGRGSTFSFEVGLEPDLGPAEPAVSPAALTGVPVLVVDDNATNRRVLAGLVQRWGGRPVCAADGPKGLTELTAAADRGEPFSLVLLDATMPGMDGFAVAERICRDPQLGTAAVLMLTSADRPGDAARCRALGVAAFLVKPVHPAELNRRIASALGDPGHSAIGRATQPAPAARPTAPGTRLTVLLAEDNAVNQRLAVRLLEKLGHTVTVVGDGRRAVEAHADRVYDLVLMDVQMPEMDGFEATAGIRRREAEGARRTPIVAMTAHAMKGDRERCLAGGMDDYLSKPIQREELFRVLKRAEEMNSRAQSGGGDERGSNGVGAPAFDRAVALERLGGD
jgi:CheY-like chemotaxis protein